MKTTDGNSYSSVSRIYEFSILSESQSIVSSSRRRYHWTRFGSSRGKKFLIDIARKLQFNQLQTQNTQLTLLYPEKKSVFVNEIHDHKQEIRSNNEMLANLHESGRNEEGKVTRSHKETWAAPRKKETSASLSSLR